MYKSILEAVGNTPLVKIPFDSHASIYAKLEYLNPSCSIKARSALYLIESAEKSGKLKPGGIIIDASSGNHASAVAMIGAAKGYKVIIAVPHKISQEKLKTIQAYGAEVIIVEVKENPQEYHAKAVELQKNTANSFMPNQYLNADNAQAHYLSTGPEIWKQTNGKITHLISGAGTGGTASGTGRFLKEQNPNIKIIAVDTNCSVLSSDGHPQPYKIEGIGLNFPDSPVIDQNIIDEIIPVADKDGISMLKPLAQNYGILAGMSSGAVAFVAQQLAKNLTKDDFVVMTFADSGRAYLTKGYY